MKGLKYGIISKKSENFLLKLTSGILQMLPGMSLNTPFLRILFSFILVFYRFVLTIVDLVKKVHKWDQVKSTAVSSGAVQPTLSKMSPLKLSCLAKVT